MAGILNHPMSKEELEATIKQLDVQIEKLVVMIKQRWGSITKARERKKEGNVAAGNMLESRKRLLDERRRWQHGLNALTPRKKV
jgi:hypothetical protein